MLLGNKNVYLYSVCVCVCVSHCDSLFLHFSLLLSVFFWFLMGVEGLCRCDEAISVDMN